MLHNSKGIICPGVFVGVWVGEGGSRPAPPFNSFSLR